MAKQRAIPGEVYGRWTLVKRVRAVPGGTYWKVRCSCGTVKEVIVTTVLRGLSTSCGCRRSEVTTARSTKHGHAVRKSNTRTYRIWAGMLYRCGRALRYEHVRVCKRWLKYENFLADMGECPKGLTLDRIKNSRGYSPSNCRWITNKEQQNNRTNNRLIRFQGRTQTLSQWCQELNLKYKTTAQRLYNGYTVKAAFS